VYESTGDFLIPDGSERSPDASLVRLDRRLSAHPVRRCLAIQRDRSDGDLLLQMMSFSFSISPASQDQVAGFTKAGSAKEPLELFAIEAGPEAPEAGPEAPEASLRRAPSSRAVPRIWPAKMSRFTLRLGTWK